VSDTIKRVSADPIKDESPDPLAAILGDAGPRGPKLRAVESTVDRANLVAVQTPQVFEHGLLTRAYAQKNLTSTDDAQLVERLGERVVVVPGESRNIKITYPADLVLARAVLGARAPEGRAAHKKF
jgi:2-C-methyl-D-erythritol 4-phosphate cytidylyltransferase